MTRLRYHSLRLVLVPKGLEEKESLLDWLAKELSFPAYFGKNWDALDECLADLSWIEEPLVLLWHTDLPLIQRRKEAQCYLRILEKIVAERGRLRASFPRALRADIKALLREIL